MTSKDVLHAFYAPVMRVKQDIVPRRYTYAWFNATKPGTYRLTCAEYCGTNHSQMACLQTDKTRRVPARAVVVVHEPGDYERYLADKDARVDEPAARRARQDALREEGLQRVPHDRRHAARRSVVLPRLRHDGPARRTARKIQMDENYIRESLMSPQAKARPGYPPSMPSFEGQLKEKEIHGPHRVHQVAEVRNDHGDHHRTTSALPHGPVTEPDFLNVTQGPRSSWLLTLDHKRIGMMYLFGILIALIVGGVVRAAGAHRAVLARQDARRRRTPTTSSSRCTAR